MRNINNFTSGYFALFFLVFVFGIPIKAKLKNADFTQLGVYNTSGPTVSTMYYVPNWNNTNKGIFLFTSAWTGLIHPDRPSIPDGALYTLTPEFLTTNQSNSSTKELILEKNWINYLEYSKAHRTGLNLSFDSIIGVSGRLPIFPRFLRASVPGEIFLMNVFSGNVYTIFPKIDPAYPGCEWYYQTFVFYDINHDGLLDIITLRFRDDVCLPSLPVIGPFPFKTEFVALLQPSHLEANLNVPWELKVLYNFDNVVNAGSGGFFDFADLDPEDDYSEPELIVPSFFDQKLVVLYFNDTNHKWLSHPNGSLKKLTLENSLGGLFTAKAVDINSDGDIDVVVSTHTADPSNGFYAYEFKLRTGDDSIRRRPIVTNLTVAVRPNSSQRFRPGYFDIIYQKNGVSQKPSIFASTDGGDQIIHITPLKNNHHDWDYEYKVLVSYPCDTQKPIIYDYNNDGKREISVPCFQRDGIFSFTEQ